MKKNSIIFILSAVLVLCSSHSFVYAQGTTQTGTQISNECNDGIDNDGDKLIDRSGGTLQDGTKVGADPQCKDILATCEDGGKGPCPGKTATPGTSTGGQSLNIVIKNPLKVDTLQGAIKLFMDAVLRIAIPFIVVFFIWSGFSMIAARGNAEKLKKAKQMFWYTILGTLLILGAWTITNIIIGTINTVTK